MGAGLEHWNAGLPHHPDHFKLSDAPPQSRLSSTAVSSKLLASRDPVTQHVLTTPVSTCFAKYHSHPSPFSFASVPYLPCSQHSFGSAFSISFCSLVTLSSTGDCFHSLGQVPIHSLKFDTPTRARFITSSIDSTFTKNNVVPSCSSAAAPQ